MYSIDRATNLTSHTSFNQSFFPELAVGASVIVSGSGIGTGIYSRSCNRGEFDRTIPVGTGFSKVFWSENQSRLLKVTGVAGSTVRTEEVPLARHVIVATLSSNENRFSFTAAFDMLLIESESVVRQGLILHPYADYNENENSYLVLQRNDVCDVDRLVASASSATATLVFYSAVNAKSICNTDR